MSIELFIYLAGVVDALAFWLVLLGTMAVAVTIWICFITYVEKGNLCAPDIKRMLIFSLIFIFAGVLVPPGRTLYMIAGAHYGKEAMQTETAQKVVKLLNAKLDEELAKLGGSK